MHNPRLAGRYAKSLIDLAREKDQLEEVYQDMLLLQGICRSSRPFVNLLKSPIIKADKKAQILNEITRDKISHITNSFNNLMIAKGREETLPEIIEAFINMYNGIKGIFKVKLTTAQPVSEELKQNIVNRFTATTAMQNIELEAVVKEELIGGFMLEFNNNLIDASVLRDLRDIKKQFMENIYIQKIR